MGADGSALVPTTLGHIYLSKATELLGITDALKFSSSSLNFCPFTPLSPPYLGVVVPVNGVNGDPKALLYLTLVGLFFETWSEQLLKIPLVFFFFPSFSKIQVHAEIWL